MGTLDIKPLMGVVLGSHSRKDMLFSCVEGIHANGVDVSREVPVIDGGPTDAAAMPFRNVPVEEYFQARRTIRDTLFVNHGFHRMDARRAPGGFEEDLHERSTSVGDD